MRRLLFFGVILWSSTLVAQSYSPIVGKWRLESQGCSDGRTTLVVPKTTYYSFNFGPTDQVYVHVGDATPNSPTDGCVVDGVGTYSIVGNTLKIESLANVTSSCKQITKEAMQASMAVQTAEIKVSGDNWTLTLTLDGVDQASYCPAGLKVTNVYSRVIEVAN